MKAGTAIMDINEIRINYDMVLILPEPEYDEADGIRIRDFYSPEKHINPYGKAIVVPDALNYQGYRIRGMKGNKKSIAYRQKLQKLIQRSPMEWDTDLEIEKGDRIMFRYIHQLEDENVLVLNDTRYLNIPYSSLIARFREEEIYPLNGFVLIEEQTIAGDLVPDKRDVNSAIVAYTGSKIRQHLNYNIPECEVNVGDEIFYRRGTAINIEYPLHLRLGRTYPLMRIHRKDILSVNSKI